MGTIIAAIIIIALIIYTIKDLLKINDISMWINILLTTIVLFTVILSIFIILHKNKPNIEDNPPPQPMATQQEMANSKPERTQPSTSKQEPKNNEDLSEEDLMVSIAEEYLTAKYDYEKANPGKTGDDYAKNAIVKKYGLTESEWADFYEESLAKGYFKKAEANLKNRNTDYLISK